MIFMTADLTQDEWRIISPDRRLFEEDTADFSTFP
jgi:hypothetical protein